MSTEKDQALEELQNRVDELEAKVNSDTGEEATGGRREFLQALGLGGLAAGVGGGTGYAARSMVDPAAAQSSGTGPIGDVDEINGPITGGTPITDLVGSGLSINSGSLEASGTGGIFEDTDSDGIYEQTSGAGISVDELSSGVTNEINWVAPGESIQTAIDNASANNGFNNQGVVALHPNGSYTVSQQIVQKQNVTLYPNGAVIEPSGDHSVWRVEGRTRIIGPMVIYTNGISGYTSQAFSVDAESYGNHMRQNEGTQVEIEGPVFLWGSDGEGDGFVLNAGGGNYITGGNRFAVIVNGYNRGVHFATGSTSTDHINGNDIYAYVSNSTTCIEQTGSAEAKSDVYGAVQAGSSTQYGIHNKGTGTSIHLKGWVWDLNAYGTAPIAGPHLKVDTRGRLRTDRSNFGIGTVVNGVGVESASAETPTAGEWKVGDIVSFTDSGDDSGTGTYLKLPNDTWAQVSTTTV